MFRPAAKPLRVVGRPIACQKDQVAHGSVGGRIAGAAATSTDERDTARPAVERALMRLITAIDPKRGIVSQVSGRLPGSVNDESHAAVDPGISDRFTSAAPLLRFFI